MIPYESPEFEKNAFNCPHCDAFTNQEWSYFFHLHHIPNVDTSYKISKCVRCNEISIWQGKKMIFPLSSSAPLPNEDMPKDAKKFYLEARDISSRSPVAASALLRLCLEEICTDLGEKEGKLNTRIKNLVDKGLPEKVQKSFDIVRITGSDQIHSDSELDLNDDSETTNALFEITNIIVQRMITDHNLIDDLYNKLPEEKRQGVENRDKN